MGFWKRGRRAFFPVGREWVFMGEVWVFEMKATCTEILQMIKDYRAREPQ